MDKMPRKSCVLADVRYKSYSTSDALAALKNLPAYNTEMTQYIGFPKRIGSEADCFAKCKHVPWYMLTEAAQKSKREQYRMMREQFSCHYARALKCKIDGGKVGYIDWVTNQWRTC